MPADCKGTPASIGGPDELLRWPEPTVRVEFELEYALVIGRPEREIAPADSWTQVAGIIILNDFSARGQQASEMPLLMGPTKGKDFHGGTITGPYLATTGAIADPGGLQIVGRVNGQVVCEARSDGAYWKSPGVLARTSRGETPLAGDIIASGTVPSGSLLERGAPFEPGQVVEVEGHRPRTASCRVRPRAQRNGRVIRNTFRRDPTSRGKWRCTGVGAHPREPPLARPH